MIYYSHEIALILSIILTSFSQILLKKGSTNNKSFLKNFIDINILFGYFLFFLVTILNVYALQKFEYKTLTSLVPISYVLVSFLSFIFFQEKINLTKIVGTLLIIIGIVIFSI